MTESPGTYTTLHAGDQMRLRDPGDLRLDGGQLVGEYLCLWPFAPGAVVVMMPGGYVRVGPAGEWERLGARCPVVAKE